MDFFQNPFYVLGATPQDNRRRIMELADSRSLVHDPDECRKAAATLTHPRRRLSAEMAWMLGVLPKHVNSVLWYLESSVRNLIGMDKLAQFRNSLGISKMMPVASANLLAAGISRLPDYPSVVVVSWIVEIAATSEEISLEQVRAVINVERKVSGFPTVAMSNVEAEFQNLREYYRQVMTSALNHLSPKECAEVITEVVESVTDDETPLPRLIDHLVDWYELEAQEPLEEHERKLEELDEKLRFEADEERPDSALAPVVDQLIQTVKIWDVIAQPIQVSKKSQGLPHDASSRVARRVRELAVHLFNQYDRLNFAQKLTNMLREVFAEVGEVAELLEEDARTLANVANNRARLNEGLEKYEKIKDLVEKLRAEADAERPDSILSPMVNQLRHYVKKWDVSAQPNEANIAVANLVRGMALHLWNEHQKLDFSLQLTNTLKEAFAIVSEVAEHLVEDARTLREIADDRARQNEAVKQFEKIKAQVEKLQAEANAKRSDYFMKSMVNELIRSVKEWDTSAKPNEANIAVANLVRGLALHLWNEHQKLDFSLQLTNALQEVFAGITDIADRIAEDKRALNKLTQQRARMIETSVTENSAPGFLQGCLWQIGTYLGIIFILGIVVALFQNC